MTSKRLHLVLSCLIALLLVGLLAGTYGVNKMLTAKATELTKLKAKNQALEQEKVSLKKSQKDIDKYAELYKITQAVVPEDKDQAQTVREIVNIAAENGVSLASITFPASSLGGTGAVAPGATGGTAAPTPGPAANSNAGKLSQLQPVKNIPGVYELPITVESDSKKPVPYARFIGFLSALERNRRTAQVSNIIIEPDPKNNNLLTFTLNLKEYIRP